jgi:hypothetical protein
LLVLLLLPLLLLVLLVLLVVVVVVVVLVLVLLLVLVLVLVVVLVLVLLLVLLLLLMQHHHHYFIYYFTLPGGWRSETASKARAPHHLPDAGYVSCVVRLVLDVLRALANSRQVQVGSETERGVPPVRHHCAPVLVVG